MVGTLTRKAYAIPSDGMSVIYTFLSVQIVLGVEFHSITR